jgi:hypothetical protein
MEVFLVAYTPTGRKSGTPLLFKNISPPPGQNTSK